MALSDGGNAQNFVGGGYSGPAFRHAVIDHRGHPGLHRGPVDGIAVGLGVDEAAHAFVDLQDLEHADPSPVPGTTASLAALGFVDRLADLESERFEAGIIGEVGRCEIACLLAAITK